MTTVLDWPYDSVTPYSQLVTAGGEAVDGGVTMGGVRMSSPEPGGFVSVQWTFSRRLRGVAGRLASGLISDVRNGQAWRLKIKPGRQTVPAVDLGVPDGIECDGLLWDGDHPWLGDNPWAFNPAAPIVASGEKGSTTLVVNLTAFGEVVQYGTFVGEGDHCYRVAGISYEGGVATLTVSPPLRRAVTTSSLLRLRPLLTAICTTPDAFEALFDGGNTVRPGSIQFTEVVV